MSTPDSESVNERVPNPSAKPGPKAAPGPTVDPERIGPKKVDDTGQPPRSGAPEPPAGRPGISQRKLAANRANAQKSTGPKSEEGKETSKLNSLVHGMLAGAVVITRGDYREDAVAFQELLDALVELYRPVGVAEQLEVENIAKCQWRKIREARYTNAITRRRTLGVRHREGRRRVAELVVRLKDCTAVELEETAGGLQHLVEVMKNVKMGIQAPELSEEVKEQLTWLVDTYLDDLAEYPELRAAVSLAPEAVRQVIAAIGRRLPELIRIQIRAAELEKEQLEAKIDAAALPLRQLDRIARYVTSNDRELERSLKRLDMMQQRRKASGRIWPTKAS